MERRDFLLQSATLVGASAVAARGTTAHAATATHSGVIAQPTSAAMPITMAERLGRIDKARRLMTENGIDAMVLEGGTSMFYYTGVRWGNSERTFAVVFPALPVMAITDLFHCR